MSLVGGPVRKQATVKSGNLESIECTYRTIRELSKALGYIAIGCDIGEVSKLLRGIATGNI